MIVLLLFAGCYCLGCALGILQAAGPEKRKKYAIKALGFYLGLFTGYAGAVLLDLLIAHFHRRRAFKIWKYFKGTGILDNRTL